MLDFCEKVVSRKFSSFSAFWCSHKIVEIRRWVYIPEMRHLRENLKGEKNFNTLFVFYLRSLWSNKKDNISSPSFQRVCIILIAILLILPCARTIPGFFLHCFLRTYFPTCLCYESRACIGSIPAHLYFFSDLVELFLTITTLTL